MTPVFSPLKFERTTHIIFIIQWFHIHSSPYVRNYLLRRNATPEKFDVDKKGRLFGI
jgi:hypothetical protein